jgi:spore cortex formation protein SpoVR/YcgB (stage V sporulation)
MGIHYDTKLPPDLRALKQEIEGYARDYGLDFYETIFEVLEGEDLNEVAAYGGFPTRYPHWSFGMSYEELKKGYDYGLSKIYEMVINNDPCYAYLMRCNHTVDQKLVMAHVYGHCDFFKNNLYFAQTDRKMVDRMANHATRVRRYVERYGVEPVETFIDACLSIEDLIDAHAAAIKSSNEAPGTPISIRQMQDLNNIVEQDHRFIKKRVRSILGFKSFDTATSILSGVEAMHMIKKEQIDLRDQSVQNQKEFIHQLFGLVA